MFTGQTLHKDNVSHYYPTIINLIGGFNLQREDVTALVVECVCVCVCVCVYVCVCVPDREIKRERERGS